MKRFLLRLAAFALATLAFFAGVLALSATPLFSRPLAKLTASTAYDDSAGQEMAAHIANVQADDGATRLILGDSVAWQVCDPFSLCNTAYRIDASNRGVTLAGQYLLAKAFLDAHPGATHVYLMLTPESFAAAFDAETGYQYAASPFAAAGLLEGLDPVTLGEMRRAYGAPFVTRAFARAADDSPLIKKLYLNALAALGPARAPGSGDGPLAPMAARCLQNMATLCAERGVAFHLLCAPLPDTDERHGAMDALRGAFEAAGLAEGFSAYFDSVPWYDAGLFGADGIHFDSAKADMDFFAGVVRSIQADTGLLDGIVLSYD